MAGILELKGFAMSRRSKPSLKFLIARALWLCAIGGAYAQDPPEITTLKLSISEAVELQRLIDLQRLSQAPPPAFWDLQLKLNRAWGGPSAKCE
jgi:hypothetical protein